MKEFLKKSLSYQVVCTPNEEERSLIKEKAEKAITTKKIGEAYGISLKSIYRSPTV